MVKTRHKHRVRKRDASGLRRELARRNPRLSLRAVGSPLSCLRARPASPTHNFCEKESAPREVRLRPTQRTFSAEYKRKIFEDVEACKHGELGLQAL